MWFSPLNIDWIDLVLSALDHRKSYIFFLLCIDEINEDVDDDNMIDNENNQEEHFQIQSSENDNKCVLVNNRIDYTVKKRRRRINP